ncbi:MAG: prenyltransferase/squalene oxidase repeat-containing protein [Candidatus Thorarchaeota archaeon]
MNKDDLTSDGIDVIGEIVDNTTKKLNDQSLHALERAPINDGIQYIRGLQHKSGGFSLMADEEETPLMTGYALLAMGLVGMRIDDPGPAEALKYLQAIQHSSGGIGYYIDSGPSLGPTAIAMQALIALGAPKSMPCLQGCQKFLASRLQDGVWRESFAIDTEDACGMEVALTAICVRAVGDALLSTQRQRIIQELLAVRNHDGGWGWAAEHASDVDHTSMAMVALTKLAHLEGEISSDVQIALEQGKEFLLACQNLNGGFSQRGSRDAASAIDTSGLAAHALGELGKATDIPIRKAAGFFLRTQNADGGWGDKPGACSDCDSTAFVIAALMSAGETIITLQEVEHELKNLENSVSELFQERVSVIIKERDNIVDDLKGAERKVQMLEASIGIVVTFATIMLALMGFG